MLSLSSASAEALKANNGHPTSEEIAEHYQIEAEYYRNKAAALMQKYEPPANEEVAVTRVVLDVLNIRQEEEATYLRRLQKADEIDRQAIAVSEIYLEHITREIAKTKQGIDRATAIEA